MQEFNLIILKPCCCRRGIIGKIVSIFEDMELNILNLKMFRMTEEQANIIYPNPTYMNWEEHKRRIDYLTQGKCVLLIVSGEEALKKVVKICGDDKPHDAALHTIRFRYGVNEIKNVVYYSKDWENFQRDSKLFLGDDFAV